MNSKFAKIFNIDFFCKVSLVISLASWMVFGSSVMFLKWSVNLVVILNCLILWLLGGLIGISCLATIKLKHYDTHQRLKRIILWSTISCVIPITYIVGSQVFIKITYSPYIESRPCREQLTNIAGILIQYASRHDDYLPAKDNWCSVLVEEEGFLNKLLVCPSSKAHVGQSSYMINKHVLGLRLKDIDPDTILLFETKPSWNKAGDAEDIVSQNHKGGINVVSVSGESWFSLMHEVSGLKWSGAIKGVDL